MKTREEVERLEKLIVQLEGMHSEITQLAKKSPNDGLNLFKLKLVNKVIATGNDILQGRYRPFDHFEQFEEEALPSNSDVTMILAQYMEQAERFRSDNVAIHAHSWRYLVDGKPTDIDAKPPTKVGGVKK
ncbi:hypothetical protein SAMN05216228_10265 [Rhizobium tibeticum]|uniref:Uncharacterized protein n=1 Tax=Rhizobium tibeticum TaxID=501024 RepID=A0A1H8SSS8_9HYPH|nr:hypothetical protein [Rhizobium tibeticum]SEI13921.1 hypothetical protein RTCCBAU85039_5009 [Rhizobium tibeticum]SEO81404.1 hypothetical protein SAMN05216228_10265 [Rhizobium tibeticum]